MSKYVHVVRTLHWSNMLWHGLHVCFSNLVVTVKSIYLSRSDRHEGLFSSSMQCMLKAVFFLSSNYSIMCAKVYLEQCKFTRLIISCILQHYLKTFILLCFSSIVSLSAWEFNYVLLILLRRIYRATQSDLNGLSNSFSLFRLFLLYLQ